MAEISIFLAVLFFVTTAAAVGFVLWAVYYTKSFCTKLKCSDDIQDYCSNTWPANCPAPTTCPTPTPCPTMATTFPQTPSNDTAVSGADIEYGTGTAQQCSQACMSMHDCLGFVRSASVADDDVGGCTFKRKISLYNNPSYNTYLRPSQ
jgi:hypothetical protein